MIYLKLLALIASWGGVNVGSDQYLFVFANTRPLAITSPYFQSKFAHAFMHSGTDKVENCMARYP